MKHHFQRQDNCGAQSVHTKRDVIAPGSNMRRAARALSDRGIYLRRHVSLCALRTPASSDPARWRCWWTQARCSRGGPSARGTADGRALMRQYDQILRAAERRFGVDRHVIAAVWGVETDYGREGGRRLAVDFDGDGRRNLVRSVADALGSTANYLKRSGWQPGDPWMIEVTVPRGYDGPTGRGNKSSLSSWAQRKVLRADGARLSVGAPVVYKQAGLPCRPGRRGRAFSPSATSTRSIPTIRPNPTRSPSPASPTASPATRRFAPPGRPTIPA